MRRVSRACSDEPPPRRAVAGAAGRRACRQKNRRRPNRTAGRRAAADAGSPTRGSSRRCRTRRDPQRHSARRSPRAPESPGRRPPAPGARGPRPPVRPHWLLSLFTPAADDRVDWARGNYTLLTRSGRVDASGELKKQLPMVAEGSVVYAPAAPRGSAPDVAPDGFAHPVFRAGFALSIPLPEVSG